MKQDVVHIIRTSGQPKVQEAKEQMVLFTEDGFLPDCLPHIHELKPSYNLSAIFDDCHNYVYANEGLLKEKIFHEIVKLLAMKLYDERTNNGENLRFGITLSEYRLTRANVHNSFEERMNHLFNTVRDQYQHLFNDNVLKLKPLTLAYIVGRLQHISLTNTPGDIKGEAFQTFVYRHQRGDRGEFFTPYPIVRLAVEMTAPQPGEKLIDPACGSGGFLMGAISYIQRNFPDTNKTDHIREFVCGIEFNPDIALAASIRIALDGGRGAEIICANTLSGSNYLDGSFDVVLTNPPFGNKGRIEDQEILKSYILARKWHKLSDNTWEPTKVVIARQSPDILFIEKCLMLLKPGGRMAIVLPDGLLQNISSNHIRFWIQTQASVLGVVSIPQEAFVPYGTGIKTSLILLQKHPSNKQHSACFMARMQKVGYDVKGQTTHKRDSAGKLLKDASGSYIIDDDVEEIVKAYRKFVDAKKPIETNKVYSVTKELLDSRLDAEHYRPDDLRLIEQLQAGGAKHLGEISEILSKTADFRLVPDGEIRYIAISDVDSRTMQVVSQQIIKAHNAPSRATYRVRKGDIITAISGASTGTCKQASAMITEEENGAICSNGFAVIRNIRGVNALFLLAYMQTEYYLRQVKRLMTGHAIPTISTEDLSRVLVPIPPKDEQEKIAEAVATIQTMRREASHVGEKVVAETEQVISCMH